MKDLIQAIFRQKLARLFPVTALAIATTQTPAATLDATFNSPADVPVTADAYTATGNSVNFTLNFAPSVGTDLIVVSNTGLDFIDGVFDNLSNGQPVSLSYAGTAYPFVANYYAGSGNDLALQWANVRPFAWGSNVLSQLGDGTAVQRIAPVPVNARPGSALFGRTVIALSATYGHNLALCSDGTVAAWGRNESGEIGDNSTSKRPVAVAVNTQPGVSALYGKTVIAVSAGGSYSLALCSDGTVAAWGGNFYDQLGDNTTTNHLVPVAVNTDQGVSALYGKKVVAISAGGGHSLALCSDGTLAAWGSNDNGQVGDNTTTNRQVPVAVNTEPGVSALYGKKIVGIAAGYEHSLALCSDGTVAWWGWAGDLAGTKHSVPVAVDTSAASALYGKTVVALAGGGLHSLALCSDGTVAAWGSNSRGQLGDNTFLDKLTPVAVNTAPGISALSGRRVVALFAGQLHSVALCSDGTLAAWGFNLSGALGDGSTTNRPVPVAVQTGPLATGERFNYVSTRPGAFHTVALVAGPTVTAPALSAAANLSDGSFHFVFANTPGAPFTPLVSTNPSVPLAQWTPLAGIVETAPGQYQFSDPQKTTNQERFYRVTSP